jgi:hypothetical protein
MHTDSGQHILKSVLLRGSVCWGWFPVLFGMAAVGCSQRAASPVEPISPQSPPERTVAVAPALNFSGRSDFDPVRVADLFASELSETSGVGVIGLNRVLAVLADQGLGRVQSPKHAVWVAEQLGADSIVVFAVTEYDPYTPIVGLAAQMYGRQTADRSVDPVAASRMARPFAVGDRQDPYRPRAQTQRTFNAGHEDVQRQVRGYAETRMGEGSAYGWRRCLVSQEAFVRFCCHVVIRDLMAQTGRRDTQVVSGRLGREGSE